MGSENFRADFKTANRLAMDGHYDEAISIYRYLLQKNPSFLPYRQCLDLYEKRRSKQNECLSSSQALPKKLTNSDRLTSGTSSTPSPMSSKIERTVAGIPFKFALIRIIGNELYPRHNSGQTVRNLNFILEEEPAFPDCIKIFLINRMFDEDLKQTVREKLVEKQKTFFEIPFSPTEYTEIPVCQAPLSYFNSLDEINSLHPQEAARLLAAVYRFKNNYVMNNNGARNFALTVGKQYAEWILPWDGSCCLNRQQFDQIDNYLVKDCYRDVYLLPMHRLETFSEFSAEIGTDEAKEEPQVLIRADSSLVFNTEVPYGRRPKVELFWHLGVPGPWNKWDDDPWDVPRREPNRAVQSHTLPTKCFRLPSGREGQDSNDVAGRQRRHSARHQAIFATLEQLDIWLGVPCVLPATMQAIKKNILDEVKSDLPERGGENVGELAVFADRADGLGERLRAILVAYYLAKTMRVPLKISWPDKVANEEHYHDIVPATEVFESDFVQSSFIAPCEVPEPLVPIRKIVNPSQLSGVYAQKYGFHGWRIFQNAEFYYLDEQQFGIKYEVAASFWEIPFSRSIKSVLRLTKKLPIDNNCVAIHVRGGDLIYGKYRLTRRYQHKAVPVSVALDIARQETDEGNIPIFFAQDAEIINLVRDSGFQVSTSFYNNYKGVERAFADVILMSRCKRIWGGTSGFSELAARIGEKRISRVHDVFGASFIGQSCARFILENADAVSGHLIAFHCSALLERFGDYKQKGQLTEKEVIEIARSSDPENPIFLLMALQTQWKFSRFDAAENILEGYVRRIGSLHKAKQLISQCLAAKYMGAFTMEKTFDAIREVPPSGGKLQNELKKCIPAQG